MNYLKEEYGRFLLRWSMALVFIIFGIMQVYAPTNWTGFVPAFVANILSPATIVLINGSVEIFLGLLLLFGLYTRIAALILGLHLFGITLSLGLSPLALRDFGLSLATLSLVFLGPDRLCLDMRKKKTKAKKV
ncbi:MAG: DoxX family membrane protein [Nanoarchaeota archaeon]